MSRRLLAVAVASAALLSACGGSPEGDAPDSSSALVNACRTFAVEGAPAATVGLEALKNAVAASEWSPESYKGLFIEAKAGVSAAAQVRGLADSEFQAFKELAEAVTRGEHALTAIDGYPTRRMATNYEVALTEVNELCGFEAAPAAE